MEYYQFFKDLLNPESIITYGGFFLLVFVIFAETGLLIGFFLPGDSLLFTAGLLCAVNILDTNIIVLVISLTLAAILGNIVGYEIGFRLGPKLFKKEESWFFKPRYLEMTEAFYQRHGMKAIILGRFLPIFRTFIPVFAGAIKFHRRKFFIYNITGAIAWIFSLVFTGYYLGKNFPGIEEYLEYIVIFLIAITAIPVVRTYLKEKKEHENRKK